METTKVPTDMDVEMREVTSDNKMTAEAVQSVEEKRKRRASDDIDAPDAKRSKSEDPSPSSSEKSDPPATTESEHKLLCDFYPQCDPDVIWEKLSEKKDADGRVLEISKEIEEEYGYIKWEYKPLPTNRERELQELLDLDTHFDNLVNQYEDLLEAYEDTEKDVSDVYIANLKPLLEFDFPRFKTPFLMKIARRNDYHLLPTYRDLQSFLSKGAKPELRRVRKFASNQPKFPAELDHAFFQELLFTKNEDKIRCHREKLQEERTARLNELKSQGLLHMCNCCCNEELLPEDFLECPDGHQFCKSCIGQSTGVVLGQARGKIPCLNGDCDESYTLPVIRKCVSPKIFSLFLKRFHEEDIQTAGIENLAACPFCIYATIIDDPDVTILKCFNPSCMVESCRLCKERNHIPLRCNEFKELKETNARVKIENEMAEAMLRKCWKCHKSFLRDGGCNVMTCVCGAVMCYICKKKRVRGGRYCGCRYVSSEELHKKEVEDAYWKAREDYLKTFEDPENIIVKQGIDKLLEQPTDGSGLRNLIHKCKRFTQDLVNTGISSIFALSRNFFGQRESECAI